MQDQNETLPDLKPMPDADRWSLKTPVGTSTNIEITDPRHFLRTLQFASDNGLSDKFATPFMRLMNLLCQDGGAIWPDGQNVPSFVWRGAGLVGGFIFHRDSRDWSIHT